LTGCLSIVRLDVFLADQDEDRCRNVNPANRTIPNNTQSEMYLRNVKRSKIFGSAVSSLYASAGLPAALPVLVILNPYDKDG
jgi:hypothetical protein